MKNTKTIKLNEIAKNRLYMGRIEFGKKVKGFQEIGITIARRENNNVEYEIDLINKSKDGEKFIDLISFEVASLFNMERFLDGWNVEIDNNQAYQNMWKYFEDEKAQALLRDYYKIEDSSQDCEVILGSNK